MDWGCSSELFKATPKGYQAPALPALMKLYLVSLTILVQDIHLIYPIGFRYFVSSGHKMEISWTEITTNVDFLTGIKTRNF